MNEDEGVEITWGELEANGHLDERGTSNQSRSSPGVHRWERERLLAAESFPYGC